MIIGLSPWQLSAKRSNTLEQATQSTTLQNSIQGGKKGGALGAVIAEATAELYNAGSSGAKPFTKELGQITAIVAAAAAGQDVAVAQLAGGNAVENNFLTHTDVAQLRKEFESCNKKAGGCTEEEVSALVTKYRKVSDNNIDAVAACNLRGNPACILELEGNAASRAEIMGVGLGSAGRIFEERASLAQMGRVPRGANSAMGDVQSAERMAAARQQICGGMSASACDSKILALKGEEQVRALGVLAAGMVGTPMLKVLMDGVPALAAAAKMAASSCASNVILCANRAGIALADIIGADATGCIDPALSAQLKPLKHKLQQAFSSPVPGEGAGDCKSESSRQAHDWHAANSQSGGGVRIGLSTCV